MKFTIDSFNSSYARVELENGELIDIPTKALPSNVVEGDVISISVDKNATESRKNKINKLMNDLFVD